MLRIISVFLIMLMLAACSSAETATPEPNEPEGTTTEIVQDDTSEQAAVSDSEDTEAEASADETEEITTSDDEPETYSFELTESFDTPMNWGGSARIYYPAGWRVVPTNGRPSIYGPDSYVISIAVNNDPNDSASVDEILDRQNPGFEIETIERDGRTFFYTYTRGGNALSGGVDIDDEAYIIGQIVNTRTGDLEPMLETMLDILQSAEIVAEDNDS